MCFPLWGIVITVFLLPLGLWIYGWFEDEIQNKNIKILLTKADKPPPVLSVFDDSCIHCRFGFLRAVVEMPESKTDLHRVRTPDEYRYQFVHCTGGMFILVPDIKTSSPITIEAPYSSSFGKKSSSDLHKDYIARQTSSTLTDEPQSEIGFLWSWNFMLSKRWRSGNTGDEHFQDKMLADFRVFCSNADNRLTQFWTDYVEE